MAEQLLEEQRENWGSRAGFVLAAIGSAVGLGNLWGFPYKVYDNGGGAFLIPYMLAMVAIGIPLLILELSLGHMTQRAAPDAFRGVSRRTEPVGWWGIFLAFVIITYYAVILAWCGSYLVECIRGIVSGGDLPWAGEGLKGVENAKNHFSKSYLKEWTTDEISAGAKPWSLGRLVVPITISLAAIWVLLYLCIFRGVRMVSKVVMLTVPLPWIMLLILTVRGLTLEGSAQGLAYYLEPTWEELIKPETWRWAFGQMFFSMSLAFGVMITYASFLHRKSDINNNAAIIGLADVGTSFVAGIAVFATLGGMAFVTQQAGHAVPVTKVASGGPGLAFEAFPYALAQLPHSAWFGAVFFIALLTLGIDSAFSITESVLAAIVDKTGWHRGKTLIGLTIVGFVCGLIYCTRGGLKWLGGIDDFINSPWGGIVLLGLLQAVVLGWMYRLGRLREHANELSDWKLGRWWEWLIRFVAPILLSALFVWSLLDKSSATSGFLFDKKGDLILPTFVGLLVAVILPILAIVLSMIRSPGANVHAQHVGQPRAGRAVGALGTLLVLAAVGGLVWSFALVREAKIADTEGRPIASAVRVYVLGGYEIPQATVILLAALAAAVLATLLGSGVVFHAEKAHKRPSTFARYAAGVGVMGIGGCAGVLLALTVLLHKVSQVPEAEEPRELSAVAYVMLAGMVTILVVGLAWCFYRALTGPGAQAAEQPPETTEQN